jgi:hypothetical protein
MSKAILEFNLPDDQYEFDLAVKAPDMRSALEDIREYLRANVKYQTQDQKRWEVYDEVYQQFYIILNDNNIKL